MDFDLAAETRGLLALIVLTLFPGLAVVRAPWAAVPFLSLSFWLLCAWWVPVARSAFVGAALLVFVVLTALRVLKPLPPLRPSWNSLGVLGLALACLLPVLVLPVAPGLSLASTEATLLVWRDGFPATYEPLAPIPAFGAHAPGLPSLAADVARLSGLAAWRAVLLVAFAGAGLLAIAVGSLFARSGRATYGLGAALLVAAAALLPVASWALTAGPAPTGVLGFFMPGPAVLAGALGLAALALLVRGSGRAPAVAAGFFLGAAFTVEAATAAACLLLVALRGDPARRRWTMVLALVFALPRLAGLRAYSVAEARSTGWEALGWAGARPAYSGPTVPDASTLRAMAWLRTHVEPLARVCAAPSGATAFLPAVAQRAAAPPEVPPVYREEVSRSPGRPCRYLLSLGSLGPVESPDVPILPPFGPSSRVAFQDGHARVLEAASLEASVTSFDNVPGNPGPPRP